MKNGKSTTINQHEKFKISYGTVDFTELKSVYINISSWYNIDEEIETPEVVFSKLQKRIKTYLHLNLIKYDNYFNDKFYIVDISNRKSNSLNKKRSFINVSVTLFPNHKEYKQIVKQVEELSLEITNIIYNTKELVFNKHKT